MELPFAESWKIKMVEPIRKSTREERENRFGGLDFVRLCIPRRVYTNNHMDVIAAALKNVYDRRESITRGLKITKEAPLMRHFTVELERL